MKDSKVLPGLLIHTPEIPTFQQCGRTLVSHGAKVALYNISMAGDTDEWFSGNIKTETISGSYDFSAANTVLLQLLKVADYLLDSGVNVIACQKCVHPALKWYLRDKVCCCCCCCCFIYALLTKHEVKMAGYWPSSFSLFYEPRRS